MISKSAKRYCKEDVSKIDNYYEAVNDDENLWVIHHKAEIEENKTVSELKEEKRYYGCLAEELIFLTSKDHRKLHGKKYFGKKRRGEVICLETNEIFSGPAAASKKIGCSYAQMSRVLNKKEPTAKNYHFEYVYGE